MAEEVEILEVVEMACADVAVEIRMAREAGMTTTMTLINDFFKRMMMTMIKKEDREVVKYKEVVVKKVARVAKVAKEELHGVEHHSCLYSTTIKPELSFLQLVKRKERNQEMDGFQLRKGSSCH